MTEALGLLSVELVKGSHVSSRWCASTRLPAATDQELACLATIEIFTRGSEGTEKPDQLTQIRGILSLPSEGLREGHYVELLAGSTY